MRLNSYITHALEFLLSFTTFLLHCTVLDDFFTITLDTTTIREFGYVVVTYQLDTYRRPKAANESFKFTLHRSTVYFFFYKL